MSDRNYILAELLLALGVDQEPDKFIDSLSKREYLASNGSFAETIAQKAAELSQVSPARFLSVYDRLKSLQMKELDPLLYILSKIPITQGPTAKREVHTPRMSRKTLATPGLSKSRSFANLSGSTRIDFSQKTPNMKQRSHSSLLSQTPVNSRILNATTLCSTPKSMHSNKENPLELPSYEFIIDAPTFPVFSINKKEVYRKLDLSTQNIQQQESLIIEDVLYLLLVFDINRVLKVNTLQKTPDQTNLLSIMPWTNLCAF
jgi:hypothetical protein